MSRSTSALPVQLTFTTQVADQCFVKSLLVGLRFGETVFVLEALQQGLRRANTGEPDVLAF